jgi:hypothetical protein
MPLKSVIRAKSIQRVFRFSSEDEKKMQIQFARMCVLFEDLRVEYEGAQADEIAVLDGNGRDSRRFYFVRRSLGTVWEITQAVHALNKSDLFKAARTGFQPESLLEWDNALTFFKSCHEFLKDWRDDVGGHFLDRAAEYAITEINYDDVGICELYKRGMGADCRLKFSFDLVAMALTRNKAQETELQFLERAFTFLVKAHAHATSAVQVVVNEFIWARFGGA